VIPLPDETWPSPVRAAAPYAGDELCLPPPLDDPRRAAFISLHLRALRGDLSPRDPSLRAAALDAELVAPEPPEERLLVQPLPTAPLVPCDQWLADLVENVMPDVGLSSVERVLGPLADESPSRRARRVAAGVMAFSPYIAPRVRPFDRWVKDKRGGTDEDRASLRAVDRAPAMVWIVEHPGEPRPLLPIADRMRPRDPVKLLPDRGALSPGLLPPGCWLARVMRGPDGWYAALALPLSSTPDADWLRARMELELWALRCFVPEADWILLLRERAEVLYRCCHEWAWMAQEAS
jgi:hypothetical protein